MRVDSAPALVVLALFSGCSPGDHAKPGSASPVDVVFPFDRDPTWTAWSYEPGLVAVADGAGQLPYFMHPDTSPSAAGPGVMLSSSPFVGITSNGYVDAKRRSYEGGEATPKDIGVGLMVSRRGDSIIEALSEIDRSKTTVTVWAKPGQPTWSVALAPAPRGTGAALSPDGTLAALVHITPDGMAELSLYDVESGSQRWVVRTGGPSDPGWTHVDYPVAFSAQGDRIMFARSAQNESLAQIRGIDGSLIADVRAPLPRFGYENLGFTYGLSQDCIWISRIYYSQRSDSNTHGTNTWHCELTTYSVSRNRKTGDTGWRPQGDAFYRRAFDADPRADDCPARLVVADGGGLSVVSYQAGEPGNVRVRTFPTIPGCK